MPSTVQIKGPEPSYDGYVMRQFSLHSEIAMKLSKIAEALKAEGVQVPCGGNRPIGNAQDALCFLIDAAVFT